MTDLLISAAPWLGPTLLATGATCTALAAFLFGALAQWRFRIVAEEPADA